MMNYERSCRLCLTDLTEAPVDCSTIPELHETIKVLFDVQICRTDNIRGICNRCLDYVMGYRALKKKITECQKIIEDYEEVRKKVMETRNIIRAIPIKQEVIDVDIYECSMPDAQNINRIRPKAVTDSDINDILAIVHDKSMPMVSYRRSAMRPIKLERPSPPREVEDTRTPSIEPISSTSKDLIEKPTQRSTSTLPVGKPPLDVTEAVSSSVQTPTEKEPLRNTERAVTRKRQLPTAKSSDKEEKTEPTSAKKSISKLTRSTRTKSLCPSKAQTDASVKSQTREKHKKDADTSDSFEKSTNTPDIKDEDSITPPGNKESSIRRSSRKAKSEALQKITHHADNTTPQQRRSPRVEKSAETPNNSLVEPQQTSTPVIPPAATTPKDKSPQPQNQTIKSENESPSLGNSQFLKETSLNQSDKKRIITITLVRTKDSLNFRYCDQFKRNIDFETVSPDELEDIRKSLMVPDIWANLRQAFKSSPPDCKTTEQLKIILGDEFVL